MSFEALGEGCCGGIIHTEPPRMCCGETGCGDGAKLFLECCRALCRFFLRLFFVFFVLLLFRLSCAKWQNEQSKPLEQRPLGKKQQRLHLPALWSAEPAEGNGAFSEYAWHNPKSSSEEPPSSSVVATSISPSCSANFMGWPDKREWLGKGGKDLFDVVDTGHNGFQSAGLCMDCWRPTSLGKVRTESESNSSAILKSRSCSNPSLLLVGVGAMVQLALDVLALVMAAMSQESKDPRIERPKRAGAVLTLSKGDSGGVPVKCAERPKSMKVLRTGMSSLRGGHGVAWSYRAVRLHRLSAGGRSSLWAAAVEVHFVNAIVWAMEKLQTNARLQNGNPAN